PHVTVEMTSPEGILEAVKQGIGLTILPELYVRPRLPGTSLRVIELYDPVPQHPIGLAYMAHRHMGKAAHEFGRLCRLTQKISVSSRQTHRRSSERRLHAMIRSASLSSW
ncbi:MAG: LysR family transcriptional regulator substrate-binding protein, partial [Nitrospiraceae bacterium]|nr:LysR family transcriptional regulator substrate-binding protein [Nitrospiraceae bacterium]